MPRLSRNPGFDIRDEPDDSCDATGNYSHLDSTETEFDDAAYPPGDPFPETGRSRRRAAVAIALALSAGATTVLLARNPATTPPAAPAHPEPAAPGQATAPQVRRPSAEPDVHEPARDTNSAAHHRSRRQPAQATLRAPTTSQPVKSPAAVTSSPAPAPVSTSKPAGGEFVLGAR